MKNKLFFNGLINILIISVISPFFSTTFITNVYADDAVITEELSECEETIDENLVIVDDIQDCDEVMDDSVEILSSETASSGYKITVNQTGEGSYTLEKNRALADTTVRIAAVPADGYEFGSLTCDGVEFSKVPSSTAWYSFVMPDTDIEINLTFSKIPEPEPSPEPSKVVVVSSNQFIKLSDNEYEAHLVKGQKKLLSLIGKNGSKHYKVSYTNKKVATVDKKGYITAKKGGLNFITIEKDDVTYTVDLIVHTPKWPAKTIHINAGDTVEKYFDADSFLPKFRQKSGSSFASIDSEGTILAKKKGSAVVTASVGNIKYNLTVKVYDPKIVGKDSVYAGHSTTYKIKNGYKSTIWTCSDESIATISKKGKLTGHKAGTVSITAINNGKEITKTVTIREW